MVTIYKVRYLRIKKAIGSMDIQTEETYKLFGSFKKANEFADEIMHSYLILDCGILGKYIYTDTLELEE